MGYFHWANKQLEDLLAKNPTYQRSQFPGLQLGVANQAFNSQMPGSAQFQNNLFSSQGNAFSNINRNATDASQAIAAAAGAQGQTNNDFSDFALKQADWKKFGLQNLNEAYGANTQQDQYMNELDQQKYQNEVSLRGAQAANKFGQRKALWNTVGGIANLGVSAFTGGLFGGKGGGGGAATGVTGNQNGGFTINGRVR